MSWYNLSKGNAMFCPIFFFNCGLLHWDIVIRCTTYSPSPIMSIFFSKRKTQNFQSVIEKDFSFKMHLLDLGDEFDLWLRSCHVIEITFCDSVRVTVHQWHFFNSSSNLLDILLILRSITAQSCSLLLIWFGVVWKWLDMDGELHSLFTVYWVLFIPFGCRSRSKW